MAISRKRHAEAVRAAFDEAFELGKRSQAATDAGLTGKDVDEAWEDSSTAKALARTDGGATH